MIFYIIPYIFLVFMSLLSLKIKGGGYKFLFLVGLIPATLVEICKNFFGVDRVEHVLDPTLLMGEYFFRKIIDNNKITPSKCITYILDENTIKHKLVEKIKIKKSIESHVSLSRNKALSIQEWLNYFAHADVVITDSFHGMVFSILFKKDFYVIINKSRGADRFYSLCDMLEISNRLIDSEDCRIEDFQSLNYENINCKLSALRIKSSSFLLDSLRDVNEFLNK
ncbi:hypothetical protein C3941_25655 [Kaistia algarum]|nr:hypothetical protein C3941_25655 [Kaistia algarum]